MKPKNKIEQIYFRYEFLVEIYSTKLWNTKKIGLERDDIKQELRLKLWTAIQSYLKKMKGWKQGLNSKPIPIKFFLMSVMNNKIIDFIKEIDAENFNLDITEVFNLSKKDDVDLDIEKILDEIENGNKDLKKQAVNYKKEHDIVDVSELKEILIKIIN